jgi:hypothetical protein
MYKLLTADTGHVIYRSQLRPANTYDVNLCASMLAGEPDTHNKAVKSRNDSSQPRHMDGYKPATTISPSPVFNPQDLIGRQFLMDEQSDGQKPRTTIIQLLEDHESSLEDNPTRIKFRVALNRTNKRISLCTIRCWNISLKTKNLI